MKKYFTLMFAVLLLLAGCKNKKVDYATVQETKPITETPVAEEKNTPLLTTKWKPIEILGESSFPVYNARPYFALTEGNADNPQRLEGHGGCNRLFGEFETSGNTLKISNIGSTKMYCNETSAMEAKFLQALQKGETYEIKKETLTLYSGKDVVGRFVVMAQ